MTSRHLALTTGLVIFLGMVLGVSAGLAQEPAEAPAETAAVAAPAPAPAAQEAAVIGMGFFPFLWLLIVAAVVSLLMYFLLGVRLMGGPAISILVGWIGAWLGSPVFGHWFKVLSAHGVYFIPAVLGCAGLVYGCYSCQRVVIQALARPSQPAQGGPSPE